jgi:hypothetical protein
MGTTCKNREYPRVVVDNIEISIIIVNPKIFNDIRIL